MCIFAAEELTINIIMYENNLFITPADACQLDDDSRACHP